MVHLGLKINHAGVYILLYRFKLVNIFKLTLHTPQVSLITFGLLVDQLLNFVSRVVYPAIYTIPLLLKGYTNICGLKPKQIRFRHIPKCSQHALFTNKT